MRGDRRQDAACGRLSPYGDHGPTHHARITNCYARLRRRQQPDGHASPWTEKPSEARPKRTSPRPRNALRSFGYVTDTTKGLSKKAHCRSLSPTHVLYNHAPSGGVRPSPGRCTRFAIFNCTEVVCSSIFWSRFYCIRAKRRTVI